MFPSSALKRQYSVEKNTIPLCRDKNDSVKNKLIIRIAKEICTKFFVFIAFFIFKSNMISNNNSPRIPNSAKVWIYWL